MSKGTEISANSHTLGSMKYRPLTEEGHALRSCVGDVISKRVLQFLHFSRGQHMFSSFLYKGQFVRNSAIVSITTRAVLGFRGV